MRYLRTMSKAEKIISRMKQNPHGDWRIDQLKTIASRHGVECEQPGTSHVTFRAPNGQRLTVPAHKTIKAVYVKMFVKMIEEL